VSELPGRLVLLGHPVSHSLSPVFQDAALRDKSINLKYEALDVAPDRLNATLVEAREKRWAGNVTIPHKEAVFSACTSLTPAASRIGAVNTFRASPSGLVGHNTDIDGFRAAVHGVLGAVPRDIQFGVIGAGGTAAAILAAIEGWQGCRAIVANRGADRRDRLVERFSSVARPGDATQIADSAKIVVNATSLGMRETDDLPIDPATFASDTVVVDVVYSRRETRLVREARARGLRATDGLSMLVGQGAEAFEFWFGVRPDADLMWRAASAKAYDT
jgi:shikimate dehydrogenase